jgi:hypothetical protein
VNVRNFIADPQRPEETCEASDGPTFGADRPDGSAVGKALNGSGRPVQTLARAYDEICAGTEPWVAINEFFHEWFDYSRERRADLVAEPIRSAAAGTRANGNDLFRWAALCAAAADELCARAGMPHPAWVDDRVYRLTEPWYGFGYPGAQRPEVRAHLESVTPERLRRRNVMGGDRVFANKYEIQTPSTAGEV